MKALRRSAAGVLLGAVLCVTGVSAQAFATGTQSGSSQAAQVVELRTDSGAMTVPVPLLGDRVVSPGDSGSSEVVLRNASASSLKVTGRVEVLDEKLNPLDTFRTDLVFTADLGGGEFVVPAEDLKNSPEVVSLLAPGAEKLVRLAFDFPYAAVSGRSSQWGDQHVTFAVRLRVDEVPSPTPSPSGGLPVTGAAVAGATVAGALAVAAGVGVLLLVARRRVRGAK